MGVLLYSVNTHPIEKIKIKIEQQHGAYTSNYLCCFYFHFYYRVYNNDIQEYSLLYL